MFFFKPKSTQDHSTSTGAKVVTFLNQKGGVGKTTLTFNMAHALAAKGHRVLCLDLDPQANLSLLFGVDLSKEERPSIFQLLINSIKELRPLHVAAMLSESIIQKEKIDLIPSGLDLSGFELTVAGITAPRQLILKKFLESNDLKSMYDYILIDCPPTLGLIVVNILCACDGVIVPFRPDEFSKKGLGHFYEVLGDVGEMGIVKAPEVLMHVPNLVDLRRKQENEDLLSIQNQYQDIKVADPILNKSLIGKAMGQKKSVFAYQSKEYKELQDQFLSMSNDLDKWRGESYVN